QCQTGGRKRSLRRLLLSDCSRALFPSAVHYTHDALLSVYSVNRWRSVRGRIRKLSGMYMYLRGSV
ncbi:hypothetical protein PO909_010351, partial [Leuciscus waleckii]